MARRAKQRVERARRAEEPRQNVVLGFLGVTRDSVSHRDRWNRWRPTLGVCMQEDFVVHRLELWVEPRFQKLRDRIIADVGSVSPETEVRVHDLAIPDPWDFQAVYEALWDFARGYAFDAEREDYYVHISTGTHVAQICCFLLTESRHFPARLLQASPPRSKDETVAGTIHVVDLDLARYDRIAQRFATEREEAQSLLKSGIATRDAAFNRQIELIERVALLSREPMLLMGPTGAGKSQIARRVWELKQHRHRLEGPFVEVNCATLRGDQAASALFGHVKGAFTGSVAAREGLLRTAHGGILFLDEIGELGLDEQAMLLRALEERRFLPVGADREIESDFQLVAGTNRDLHVDVAAGRFRDDLLARIDTWTFHLPALRERLADLEPNLDYELERFAERTGERVAFNKEARERYLAFATGPDAIWRGNFRDLNASVIRMATLADGGGITLGLVDDEVARLSESWLRQGGAALGAAAGGGFDADRALCEEALGDVTAAGLDLMDVVQLAAAVRVCRASRSLAEAGRVLYAASLAKRSSRNDGDRLRKFLARFGLDFDRCRDGVGRSG